MTNQFLALGLNMLTVNYYNDTDLEDRQVSPQPRHTQVKALQRIGFRVQPTIEEKALELLHSVIF